MMGEPGLQSLDTGLEGSISGSCVIEDLDSSVYQPDSSLESVGGQLCIDGEDDVSPLPSAKNAKVAPVYQPHTELSVLDDIGEPVPASSDNIVTTQPQFPVSAPAASSPLTPSQPAASRLDPTPPAPSPSHTQTRGWPVRSPNAVVSPQQTVLSVNADSPVRSPGSDFLAVDNDGQGPAEGEEGEDGEGNAWRMRRGARLRLWLWSALTTFSMLQVCTVSVCAFRRVSAVDDSLHHYIQSSFGCVVVIGCFQSHEYGCMSLRVDF